MQELSFSDLSVTMIFDHFSTIGVPMIVGGVPASIVTWVIFYIPIRRAVANYQHHRHSNRIKRQQVLAEERRERADGVANSNTEELPSASGQSVDDLTIPETSDREEARPTATITPIGRAAGESKGG